MKIFFLLVFLFSQNAFGEKILKVVTTTPDLAYLVREIGGDKVHVQSLLSGTEDPHYIDVMPNYIAQLMSADIICFIGLDLEIGWLPKVISRSGRSHLQTGERGYCDASTKVSVLDKKQTEVDRSLGDVHAKGNSHYTLGPQRFLQAAETIRDVLVVNDPEHKSQYEKNFQNFEKKIQSLQKEIKAKLSPFRDQLVLIDYHSHFRYYIEEFELKSLGAIEEVPGVPPSAGRMASSAQEAKAQNLDLILAAHTASDRILKRYATLAEAPYLKVPLIMHSEGEFSDYFSLHSWLVNEIVKYAK